MPHPTTHLRPALPPAQIPAALDASADPWQVWSRAWTRHVPTLTGRTDLSVVVAPGAGGGAPACTYPDLGRIEINAAYIGAPEIANPNRAGHKQIVPAGYGLLVHEAAHATHSRWKPPPGTPPVVADAAALLEESRAEGCHRARRRGDRRWLRHTVTTLLDPADAAIDDAWHAGVVAALLLARADARVINARDARTARATVTAVLGRKRLAALREVWRAAHAVGDTDAETMVGLGRKWCAILDIDPDRQSETPIPDQGAFAGRLADALAGYLAAVAGLTPAEWTARHTTARHSAPATWRRRDPTAEEQRAARTLAARLAAARTHHPEPGARPASVPPGRLRTRHAITIDAQVTAGIVPTAEPWQRRAILPPPKPDLHLAVLVDTSGSMRQFMAPLSSASWILAHAAHRNHATVTTIAFANRASLVLPPRQHPTQVLDMAAAGGTTAFCEAVKLADRLLDLRGRRTLRLLAVVSDGELPDPDAAQRLVSTLHRGGCAVLWLHPAGLPGHTFTDTTTITLTDPVEAIEHISRAALTALEAA
jgi:Mg-chelatase subunit ChlD